MQSKCANTSHTETDLLSSKSFCSSLYFFLSIFLSFFPLDFCADLNSDTVRPTDFKFGMGIAPILKFCKWVGIVKMLKNMQIRAIQKFQFLLNFAVVLCKMHWTSNFHISYTKSQAKCPSKFCSTKPRYAQQCKLNASQLWNVHSLFNLYVGNWNGEWTVELMHSITTSWPHLSILPLFSTNLKGSIIGFIIIR